MRITTEEFITSFHAITGTTVGERRKNLFLLLNRVEQAESAALDISCLRPKAPLEEKFKVDVLIRFRRIPELTEVLKCENPMLIKKVLKEFWILEKAFQVMTGEELVTSVFPYISFNAKVKLLNKLSSHLKNSQQADGFFEAIEKKYGSYLAAKILPACSPGVIINYVNFKKVNLITPKQLLTVVKRYPDITESVLKILNSKGIRVGSEYRNTFKYLAERDPGLFLKLHKEYNVSYRLGWRVTDKLIQKNRQDVIKNPKKYYQVLHNKQIPKSLNRDFKDLYFNLFPESLKQLRYSSYNNVFSIVQELPRRMRDINLLLTAFEKLYGSPLWDHPDYVDLKLFEMLSPDERDSKIKPEHKPSGVSEEKWNSYMKTDRSIPYLKKTISLTSDIKTRIELVRLLVKTCAVNEDKVALAHVCKYMLTKHRNDHASLRRAFLNALKEKFLLQNLEEQHWTPINELVELFTLNKEPFDGDDFLEAYIHFRLKQGLPVRENLIEWLKSYRRLSIIKDEPRYEKQCLLMCGEIIPEVFEKETSEEEEQDKETELDSRNIEFISALIDWNERHPADQISIFLYSNAMDSIKRTLIKENNSYVVEKVIKHCLPLKTHLEERAVLLNLYLTRSDMYKDVKIIKRLVQHEISTVIDNIDIITRFFLNMSSCRADYFFWKYWKNCTHLESFRKVVNMCLSAVDEKRDYSYDTVAKNAIIALSHLLTAEEFKKFIVPYYPSELRADAKTEEGQRIYTVQENIGKCLKNLTPSSSAMESILVFCKGDYLKLIQRSLYSVSDNVNEDKLPPFLNELSGRAVSVRKHAMHIALRVLTIQQIYSMLNRFMETEKNASVRKFIFKGIFNLFVMNADDRSWELVKLNVNALDVSDKEALETLMQADKIPHQYVAQYIVFVWDVLNKLPDPERNMETNRSVLLRLATSEVIQQLPEEFCRTIIEDNFLKCADCSLTAFRSQINTFACRFTIYCDSSKEQEERLKAHFETVKNFVLATWKNSDLDVRVGARNCVADVLKEFCLEFLTDCRDTEVLVKFANLWNGFFKPHEAFDEYLHLQFTLIYVEKLSLPEVGQKLADLCDSLSSVYGFAIIHMFCKKIKFFTHYFLNGADDRDVLQENWYILIENLIQLGGSIYCLVLVSLLLTDERATIAKTRMKYMAIIEILEKNPDPVVTLYLENQFRRGGTSLDYH